MDKALDCGAERPGFESRWGKKVFPKDGECEEGRNSQGLQVRSVQTEIFRVIEQW